MKEHVLRGLDSMIASLLELKTTIAEEDSELLDEMLEHARIGRINWWMKRKSKQTLANDQSSPAMPPKGEYWRQLIGLSGRKAKYPDTNKKS